MSFKDLLAALDRIAWGPWMLALLVGTGIFLSFRLHFIQFRKFGYTFRNTVGRLLHREKAGEGEVTPFQAVATALAATIGTGNIAGVTGAVAIGGPGAVFWMWAAGLFGMVTKYAEVVLAVRFRERNADGDYVGGPMYYIKNGLGAKWKWLAVIFSILGGITAFGTGNMTQVNTIAGSVNTAIDAFGGDTAAHTVCIMGKAVPVSSLIIGVLVAVIVGLVLFGGLKRIGAVTERLVPFMAVIYTAGCLGVVIFNFRHLGEMFMMIIKGAFSPEAVLGGGFGISVASTISKGIGRGVFSNEAGLGSAPMAHAATSETDPVKQGLYGIFEVFVDTNIICTLTVLTMLCGSFNGVSIPWGENAGAEIISASFGSLYGDKLGSLIIAVGICLFALSTILSWSLYGSRCCEFLFGRKSVKVYQALFLAAIVTGSAMELSTVWTVSDIFNGFMALPNLIALLGLSGVVVKLTKEHFSGKTSGKPENTL